MQKKNPLRIIRRGWQQSELKKQSADFFYFTGSDAACADMQPYMRTVRSNRLHILQVRLGDLLGLVICMAYLIAAELPFSADLTCSRHRNDLLEKTDIQSGS
jgi:hypothetical protein